MDFFQFGRYFAYFLMSGINLPLHYNFWEQNDNSLCIFSHMRETCENKRRDPNHNFMEKFSSDNIFVLVLMEKSLV